MKAKIICPKCCNVIFDYMSECPYCGNGIRSRPKFSAPTENIVSLYKGNPPKRDYYLYKLMPNNVYQKFIELFMDLKNNTRTSIANISIEGLFNYYDYDIDLNKELSILISPNGFGKTTLLNFIYFMFNPSEAVFMKYIDCIPFKSFKIKFEDNDMFELIKTEPYPLSEYRVLFGNKIIEYRDIEISLTENKTFKTNATFQKFICDISNFFERKYPNIAFISADRTKTIDVSDEILFSELLRVSKLKDYSDLSNIEDAVKEKHPIHARSAYFSYLFFKYRDKYVSTFDEVKSNIIERVIHNDDTIIPYNAFIDLCKEYRKKYDKIRELVLFNGEGELDDALYNMSNISKEEYENDYRNKYSFIYIYVYLNTLSRLKFLII